MATRDRTIQRVSFPWQDIPELMDRVDGFVQRFSAAGLCLNDSYTEDGSWCLTRERSKGSPCLTWGTT